MPNRQSTKKTLDDFMYPGESLPILLEYLQARPELLKKATWKAAGSAWHLVPSMHDKLICDQSVRGAVPVIEIRRDAGGRIVVTGYAVCYLPK